MERTTAFAMLYLWRDRGRRKLFFERYVQRSQSAQAEILSPHDRALERKVGSTSHDRFKSCLSLDTRQRRAKTEVTSPAESEMAIVRSGNVKPIRIRKSFGIAIAGAHYCNHRLTFANLFATEFSVCGTNARGVLAGALVAQQLFDGRRNQREIISQSFQLIGVA